MTAPSCQDGSRTDDKELLVQLARELRRMLTLQRREQYVAVEERLDYLSARVKERVAGS